MKSLLFIISLTLFTACFSSMKATVPQGATICYKDPDCLEGQHCGFTWGYNGAHCIGAPRSNQKNLPPIQPMNF